ncbi:MAG: MgtC/SapB family protein [Thermoleophilia bacterium]
MRGQAAGLCTHTLVAIGATLFTLVSMYGFGGFKVEGSEIVAYDPSRVASQVVVGIGFLGVGAIMRHGTSVKGLATAASLWVVAALGMSVGVGYYLGCDRCSAVAHRSSRIASGGRLAGSLGAAG